MLLKRCASLLLVSAFLLAGQVHSKASVKPVSARRGMVSSSDEIASRVGVEVLKRGGNAIDAAVAVALTLAVTFPPAGSLGGGGFMVLRMNDGRAAAIDYRETAPAKAHRNLYLDKNGEVIAGASTVGHLSAGVPGTVAGLALALEKYGTMKWGDLVEPARRLAAQGFPLGYRMAQDLRANKELLQRFPETRRIFLKDGRFYEEGELFKQPELAETLQRLKDRGPREFYEGRTARLMAEEMKAHGGLMTLQDLNDYRPVEREVLRGTYRGYEVITMPPPSSGGIALLELLNILEHYDIAGLGESSSSKYHLLVEAMRRAFADRAEFMGDPAFVKVPVGGLISKTYAEQVRKSIDPNRVTPSEQVRPGQPASHESRDTTHFTIVDAMGNTVSNSYTINGWYGSGVTVRKAGFLLNNEMDDFAAKPGSPNAYGLVQNEANAIAPGKRPLSSMTPTVLLKDGKLFLSLGSPGGPTIINQTLQIIINVIDHGMNIQEAIDAPRIHHQWQPDVIMYEPFGISRDVMDALKSKGHRFLDRPAYMGDAQGIMIDPQTGMRLGASDHRGLSSRSVGY